MNCSIISLLVLPAIVASGCREACSSDEIRHGDRCVLRPDSGTSSGQDASSLDASEDAGELSNDDAAAPVDASFLTDASTEEGLDACTADHSCQQMPQCTPNPCLNGGRCIEEADSFGCDCEGTGYSGTICETDPCMPTPCGAGLSCARSPSGIPQCSATCASSGIGCEPGDACETDAECRTGGHSSAICHLTAKVCVTVCGPLTVVSQANLDAARYCREVDGDLALDANFSTIDSTALPFLTRVRGSVRAVSFSASPSPMESVTLAALESVDGNLQFVSLQGLKALSLPRLTSTGGNAQFELAALERISLPRLNRVQGGFSATFLANLTQIDMGELSIIGGALTLRSLCALPWTQVQRISTLGTSQSISDIGCCTTLGSQNCSGGSCGC